MKQFGNIYTIAATSVIGGALFGFDISSMSAIITTQSYLCYFNELGTNANGECLGPRPDVQGGIVAAMPGGSWLGALTSGWLSDWLGRKRSIQVGAIIWVLGSIICCAAQNIPMLAIGRVINGFSVGICSAQVPVYISEIAPPSKRGRLIGFQQWAITWGILIMYFICYGSSYLGGEKAFRLPWGIQAVPAVLLLVGLMVLPESPRWLGKKGLWDETKAVLTLIHGRGDPNSPFVAKELAEIRRAADFEQANADVTCWELLGPRMLNRTLIGLFTQIWSQLSGMNVMMYYITYVFKMAGVGDVLLPSGISFVINVVMTVPALIWMDSWGRRPTLLVGAFLMTLWMSVNAGLFGMYSRPATEADGFTSASESMAISGAPAKAVIAATYLFVASFAPTWGPVSWTYPPELYPLRLRGKAVALATSANWAFNFALAYFVPPAFATITWKTYIIFSVFGFCMFWHVFFFFPETANKPLEEVADMFDGTQPGAIKYIGQPAWKTKNDHKRALKMERNEIGPEEKFESTGMHGARNDSNGSENVMDDVVGMPTGQEKAQ